MVPEGQGDDEDEVQEEIEKQPLELEDMLELFREPEEAPRKGFNPMWLVLALIVMVGGCWLAVVGVQAFVEQMTGLQGGTPKAGKSGERAPDGVVDVQAAFRERCTKGMSKDEIRWILGDFEKLGIKAELGPLRDIITKITGGGQREAATLSERALLKTAVLKIAAREREWYADTLAESLLLDRGQRAEMKQKLAAALAQDTRQFERVEETLRRLEEGHLNLEEPTEQDAGELKELFRYGSENLGVTMAYFSVAFPGLWLESEAYAPWNLCQLSPDQLSVTNHHLVSAQHGENAAEGWLMPPEIADAEKGELPVPFALQKPAGILPLTAGQNFPRDNDGEVLEDDFLSVITKLHPAQFKLVLLCEPDLAEEIGSLLEKE